MRMGMRYNEKAKQFTWKQEDKEEDRRLRVIEKESMNARMRRICMPAINSVNQTLSLQLSCRKNSQKINYQH